MDEILKQLLQEEDELQFIKFNEDIAWQIGSKLVEHAVAEHLPITIDITRGDHQIFYASRPGTSVDNDEWVKRKVHLVYRFGHSSFYVGQLLKSKGKSLLNKGNFTDWISYDCAGSADIVLCHEEAFTGSFLFF